MHSQVAPSSGHSVSSGGAPGETSVATISEENAGGPGGGGTMPEEVFKWMAHSVNQDFLGMGYPAILTKTGEQEYVNLCPLIRNCSSVLTLVKARRRTVSNDTTDRRSGAAAAGASAHPDAAACTAVSGDRHSGSNSGAQSNIRRKRRRWGLFSSKQQRRKGRHQQPSQTQQQQQQLAASTLGNNAKDELHESMARKMRKDTERIIRRTACMDVIKAYQNSSSDACPPSPYPEGSREQADFAFMHSTWRNFRKLAQTRIVECADAAKRSEELQREVTSLTSQIERLRQQMSTNSAEDGSNLSSCGSTGRLQRVGGFLRRAVSKERLTFGRRPKLDDSTMSEGATCSGGASKRSRSCSVPPVTAVAGAASAAPPSPEMELRRIRLEFERRERLLLSEREKLRQANSKLNFRVQHLSSLASAAAKQSSLAGCGSGAGGTGGSGCGINGKDPSELHSRRLERRAAGLQKEVTSLKQELNEKIDTLTGIGAAVGKFSRAAAAFSTTDTEGFEAPDPVPELPIDAARVSHLVDSVCQTTLNRLRQLQQARGEALAKVTSIGDCLEMVRRRLGLTRAAVDNSRALEVELDAIAARLASASAAGPAATPAGGGRSMSACGRRGNSSTAGAAGGSSTMSAAPASMASSAVETNGGGGGDHLKLELRDRIIGKLTTMLRERQDEVRRLKDISLSCQDVSSMTATSAAGAQRCRDRRSQATDARSNVFR